MSQILQAKCIDGELVLDEKLSADLEGKKLKILIIEAAEFDKESSISTEEQINRFLEKAKKYSAQLPENYKFDREELYER